MITVMHKIQENLKKKKKTLHGTKLANLKINI